MMQTNIVKPGAINSLGSILENFKDVKLFLVRGNKSFTASGADKALSFIFNKYPVTEFSSFSPNPKIEEAEIGYEQFFKSRANVILCVGGGSVIDMGKIVKYLFYSKVKIQKENQSVILIAVPTTAGTGSEVTRFAVVYIDGVKKSFDEEYLLPDVALVDPELLKGQTKYQMAVSGADAFAQGIESLWNINSNEESKYYAEKGIKLIWENLEKAIEGNSDSLVKICEGSNYSGKAINITRTTAPHALSYGFTSNLNIPHGHTVALFLPFFIHYHKNLNQSNSLDSKGSGYTRKQVEKISRVLNTNLENIENDVISFLFRCGIDIRFSTLDISKEKFFDLLKELNLERLKNNPGKVTLEVFNLIFEFNSKIRI